MKFYTFQLWRKGQFQKNVAVVADNNNDAVSKLSDAHKGVFLFVSSKKLLRAGNIIRNRRGY